MKDKTKVLIIDDDQFISDMYVLKLREAGFDADAASDGAGGLEKIKADSPDIVLLDIVLPNMDGFEILKSAASEKLMKKTKFILLSNLGEKKDIEKGIGLGASDYIIKAHFTPGEVVEKVKEIIKK